MDELEALLSQVELALPRLERLTPDSPYAHKASGCRRTLLQILGRFGPGLAVERRALSPREMGNLRRALVDAFDILEAAAHEKADHIPEK